jgi:hypothetical protein
MKSVAAYYENKGIKSCCEPKRNKITNRYQTTENFRNGGGTKKRKEKEPNEAS